MVLLSALTRLPAKAILVIGSVVIAGHNLLDGVQPAAFGSAAPVWNFLHVTDLVPVGGVKVLFAYVLHLYLAHLLAMAVGVAMGLPTAGFLNPLFAGPPQGWGFSLAATYGFWLLILTILYPPTRWFAGVKARRRDWWLGYL